MENICRCDLDTYDQFCMNVSLRYEFFLCSKRSYYLKKKISLKNYFMIKERWLRYCHLFLKTELVICLYVSDFLLAIFIFKRKFCFLTFPKWSKPYTGLSQVFLGNESCLSFLKYCFFGI